jgi:hypothetical protein
MIVKSKEKKHSTYNIINSFILAYDVIPTSKYFVIESYIISNDNMHSTEAYYCLQDIITKYLSLHKAENA